MPKPCDNIVITEIRKTLTDHANGISSIEIINNETIATSSCDETIKIWSVNPKYHCTLISTINLNGPCLSFQVTKDPWLISSVLNSNSLDIYTIEDLYHPAKIGNIAMNSNSKIIKQIIWFAEFLFLFGFSADKIGYLWDLSNKKTKTFEPISTIQLEHEIKSNDYVNDCVGIGSKNGIVIILKIIAKKLDKIKEFKITKFAITNIRFSQTTENVIYATTDKGAISVWNYDKVECISKVKKLGNNIYSLFLIEENWGDFIRMGYMATVTFDKEIKLLKLQDNSLVASTKHSLANAEKFHFNSEACKIIFEKDGQIMLFCSGNNDKHIEIFEIKPRLDNK